MGDKEKSAESRDAFSNFEHASAHLKVGNCSKIQPPTLNKLIPFR